MSIHVDSKEFVQCYASNKNDVYAEISADLYLKALAISSSSKALPYLHGVNIEPGKTGGVILAATNGHELIVIHDPNGHTTHRFTLKLAPAFPRECKPTKTISPKIVIADGFARVGSAMTSNWLNDSSFPDYKRVVPTMSETFSCFGVFDCEKMKMMAASLSADKAQPLLLKGESPSSPHIVFGTMPNAFGVMAPIPNTNIITQNEVPAWF
jgi:hypothetical protein